MQTITKFGVHNFGGTKDPFAKTRHLKPEQIRASHKARGFTPSLLNGDETGYNVIIWPDGGFTQHRYLGEQTMASIGSNFDGFHSCLAGNFTKGVEYPTISQEDTLRKMEKVCLTNDAKKIEAFGVRILPGTVLKFSVTEIKPHRVLHLNHTECYGMALPDDWARRLALEETVKVIRDTGYTTEEQRIALFNQIFLYFLKLYDKRPQKPVVGAVGDMGCGGFINLEA
jgi:hypothetical protein